MEAFIWLDNAKVLSRARRSRRGNKVVKDKLVLNYDLWAELDAIQWRLTFKIKWKKVDSHIHTRIYAPWVKI